MLSEYRQKQGWEKTDAIIDRWLNQRHELLSAYYVLCDLPPFAEPETPKIEQLQTFCEVLIDYVSAGQFEVFEKIAEAQKKSEPTSLKFNSKLMEKILRTTVVFLDFNDKHSHAQEVIQPETLKAELSKLGEVLANRFEYENELISIYLKATEH
ncbi:MAG: Rsd/AlgQ family anti-sigma factor [Gammaproteobacteria bacterium]